MKKSKVLVIALSCALLAALAGCAKKPQTVTVTLPSNPTTGYSWECTQTEPLFDISSEYVENEKSEGMVGVGGKDIFTLTPAKAGETQVTFAYGQHWDGGEQGDSITYTLKVKNNLSVEEVAMTGEFAGETDSLPEMPTLEIH
ncbi:MAG: protease inhibitor I42 family protein [Lachnospiraceae bacterium]|nr:protease inhibitor I42 family protein [Lachnospiraceae bacterium]